MKERPILFYGPMVRAILEGRKTMTRRIVKPQPGLIRFNQVVLNGHGGYTDGHGKPISCPYGIPGDRLWVRETWSEIEHPGPVDCPPEYEAVYRADFTAFEMSELEFGPNKWKPSIFMPRAKSRILIEITDVRVERLLAISNEEAILEGVEQWPDGSYKAYGKHAGKYSEPHDSFLSLWDSINGEKSWELNPWVWVIEFTRIPSQTLK